MRWRNGSANSKHSGSGFGLRNRPTAFAPNGPCCHDMPMTSY